MDLNHEITSETLCVNLGSTFILTMPPLDVELQTQVSFRPAGRLVWADILLLARSAFTTSLWFIQEVEQCMERLPRTLTSIACIKISPSGRNDTVLIKPGILSVVALAENIAAHEAMYFFNKATTDK